VQRNPFSKHLLDAHPTAYSGNRLIVLNTFFASFLTMQIIIALKRTEMLKYVLGTAYRGKEKITVAI
jgi:hypothetical protein